MSDPTDDWIAEAKRYGRMNEKESGEAILRGELYALMFGKRVLWHAPTMTPLIVDAPFWAAYDQASDPQEKLSWIR